MPLTKRCAALGTAIGASVLLLASCSSASSSTTTTTPPTQALSAALHQLVAMKDGPPGAIALIQTGSAPTTLTAGVGNTTTKAPIGEGDVVRIASVSKAFNGAIALALVSRGKLSLDDTIGSVVPTLPAAWSTVTLAQLLHHTSGVPDYIKSPAFLKELQADPEASMTPTQLLGFVADQPLLFTPGSKYDYSDSDNIIVGLMVEAATSSTYESQLASIVTGPLHLAETSMPTSSALTEPFVHGYAVEEGHAPEDVSSSLNPVLAWASGGMLSSAADLNTFMRAYAKGSLFDAATRARQLRFVPGESGPPGPGTNEAGLGIYRYQTSCGTVLGHTGNFPGYTLFAASNAAGTRSAVVFVNTQLNPQSTPKPSAALRHVDELAVCAALGQAS